MAQRTLGDALLELLSRLGDSWNRPLKDDILSRKWRFIYALAGALPWFFVHLDPDWLNTVVTLEMAAATWSWVPSALAQFGLGAWFAWLISFQERPCSPSRFFLEGLLFPGVAAGLLSARSLLPSLLGG